MGSRRTRMEDADGPIYLFPSDPSARRLVTRSIIEKYEEIPKRATQTELKSSGDLRLVIDLRNLVAHYVPFVVGREEDLPQAIIALRHRGLLPLHEPENPFDFFMLCSYRLACGHGKLSHWP